MENVRDELAPFFDAPHLNCDERECLLSSYAETPAEELRDQLRRTSAMLDGFIMAAEKVDWTLYCVLSEADTKARKMLRALEA